MSVRLSSSSVDRDPDLLRDLLVGRREPRLRLERCNRALDLARPRADGARHPVHRAELVDDRALDPRDRVSLELHVAVGLVALDRADQAEQPVRDEIAFVHMGGSPLPSRPATYFTSGAYVRISRSRMPWSPDFRYCSHRVWVSSARLTCREYEVVGTFPQRRSAERPTEPSHAASASAAIATIQPRASPPAPPGRPPRRREGRPRERRRGCRARAVARAQPRLERGSAPGRKRGCGPRAPGMLALTHISASWGAGTRSRRI